jgi:hypothetical protein
MFKTISIFASVLLLSACHHAAPQEATTAVSQLPGTAAPQVAAVTAPPTEVATDTHSDTYSCGYNFNDTRKMTIVMDGFVPSNDGSSSSGNYVIRGGAFDGAHGTVNLTDTTYTFNDGPMLDHSAEIDVKNGKSIDLQFDNIPYMCSKI